MGRYPTVPVWVSQKSFGAKDSHGDAAPTWGAPARVDGCLVSPGSTSDLDAGRPEGAKVAYTVHFPQGYAESIRGAKVRVSVDGEPFDVVGDPRPYPTGALPSTFPWSMRCEVGHVEG